MCGVILELKPFILRHILAIKHALLNVYSIGHRKSQCIEVQI